MARINLLLYFTTLVLLAGMIVCSSAKGKRFKDGRWRTLDPSAFR
jgi:hypothetical protein